MTENAFVKCFDRFEHGWPPCIDSIQHSNHTEGIGRAFPFLDVFSCQSVRFFVTYEKGDTRVISGDWGDMDEVAW